MSDFVRTVVVAGLCLWAVDAYAVDFPHDVQPVMQGSCVACHGPQKQFAGLRLDSLAEFRKVGAAKVLKAVESGRMPPGGPKLPAGQVAVLKAFADAEAPAVKDDMTLVEGLHKQITAAPKTDFKPYKKTIPGTTVAYDMVAISGGEFSMGTPGRKDEEPVRRVRVQPFWMMAHEVSWDEYRLWTASTDTAVSRPTRPYVEMSFGMGINGFPAISMTQHAANKYAEWLSAKTGEFYRLPTEAEWEYACKAGGTGEETPLSDYAWYGDNSNGKYQKVAAKKPNPWGLYDMLGNVMEWTLDQYAPYQPANGVVDSPWVKATKPYPHSVRGGSWADPAESCRCGARVGSDPSWKQQDPQLPKSIWYMTDAQGLGFRLVRPAKVPSAAEMFQYWNNGVQGEY